MTIIQVNVKPNARRQSIMPTDEGIWVATVQAPPVDGKANAALIKLLAKEFGVAKSRIKIKSGQTSRLKLVEIDTELLP
jgi:uncharacterized protein (TIGR00251 family)